MPYNAEQNMDTDWKLSRLAAVVLFVTVVGALAFFGCSWLREEPNAPQPSDAAVEPSAGVPEDTQDAPVRVTTPSPDSEVSSPLIVEGEARGNWFFEASFPVRVVDEQGNVLGTGIAQALGDWMTENFVPFRATVDFDQPLEAGAGRLVLQRDNPSGLPQHDQSIEVPVRLAAAAETTTVKAFFGNSQMDPKATCVLVFPVERRVAKTSAVGRAALLELLRGPSDEERAEGYFTSINPGVGINSLVIEDGVARVDFDGQIEFQVGGSCRVGAIRAQVTETLKQFPSVREVVISVDGRTEDILQP